MNKLIIILSIISINTFCQKNSFIKEYNSIYYFKKNSKIFTEKFIKNTVTYNSIKKTLEVDIENSSVKMYATNIKFSNENSFFGKIGDINVLGTISDEILTLVVSGNLIIHKNNKIVSFITDNTPFNKKYKRVETFIKNEKGKYVKYFEADDVNYTINYNIENSKIKITIIDESKFEEDRIYKLTNKDIIIDDEGFLNQFYIGESNESEKVIAKLSTKNFTIYQSEFMFIFENK